MIIPVNDLIAAAKAQCSLKDVEAAKIFFDAHNDAVIIDVREPEEAAASRLVDATNIPRGLLEMKIIELCSQHDMPILLHCGAGGRASMSAHTLQIMGYTNVHVIDAQFDEIKQTFG